MMVNQRNERIQSGIGFFSSFDIPWSKRSWIDLSSKETQNPFSDSFVLRIQSWIFLKKRTLKALVNEDSLLRTHCCPWCFLGCANWETFVAGAKCFWTKSETFFVSRTQNLCVRNKCCACGQTGKRFWKTPFTLVRFLWLAYSSAHISCYFWFVLCVA